MQHMKKPAGSEPTGDREELQSKGYLMNVIDKTEDNVRVVRYAGDRSVKWRGDCDYCKRMEDSGRDPAQGFFPDHDAMRGCRSGGNSHCTCDGCF